MASTHDAGGYWEVASDGGVFSFGDAQFHGSTGSIRLNKPMVSMAVTPDGGGYWLVASDGGIFAFGDAGFYGSTGSMVLNDPVIGIVPTHDGGGYWLMASDGGLFAFGDAGFHGSLGSSPSPTPIVGVAPTPDGGGYWLLESNGAVHPFGNAPAVGIAPGSPAPTGSSAMTGLIPDFSGRDSCRQCPGSGLRLRRRALLRRRDDGGERLWAAVGGDRRHSGLTGHLGERGTREPAEGAEPAGVDTVVGRMEQAQVAPAVAVGPDNRVGAVRRKQALGTQVHDEAGVLLGPRQFFPS